MQEDFEYKGKWWPPGSERIWDGILKYYHNKAIILDLEGFFGEDNNYFEILLGEANNGKKITIVNAIKDKSTLYPNTGNETRAFDCGLLLIGEHFNEIDDIKFKKVYLRPTHLTEWMLPPKTFLEDLIQKRPLDKKDKIYSIKEKGINKEIILESLNSKLIFNLELCIFGDCIKTCEFKYKSYLIIESVEPRELTWFLDLNDNLCNFLTLITRHPVYSNFLGADDGKNSIVDIHLIISDPNIAKDISMHNIDIKFSDLDHFQGKSYIELCINKWFEKKKSLKSVYELFHMISYIPVWYEEAYFLTIMQALEALYGHAYEKHKYLEKGKWRPIRDELIKSVPNNLEKDLKENIENKIKYGNEYSLKTKIKILFRNEALNDLIQIYGGFGDDRLKKICDTRDFFIHHGTDYEDKILTKDELSEVNKILNISLKILILTEIGIPEGIIRGLFGRKIMWLKYYYKK